MLGLQNRTVRVLSNLENVYESVKQHFFKLALLAVYHQYCIAECLSCVRNNDSRLNLLVIFTYSMVEIEIK